MVEVGGNGRVRHLPPQAEGGLFHNVKTARHAQTLCTSTSVCIKVLLSMKFLSMQQNRVFYKTSTFKDKDHQELYDVTLLLIYFNVHKFSFFYISVLKIFQQARGCPASPAPISANQQSPLPT